MKRSDIHPLPEFFDRYIHLVQDIELTEALEEKLNYRAEEVAVFKNLKDLSYAKDKWTVKDILQHVIDTERIQAYRALRFARKDKNLLPGFDEVLYGATAHATNRTVDDLLLEHQAVRQSTIALFKSFSQENLLETGICFNISISVLALGFVIAGHQIHHLKIIRERYLPLIAGMQ